MLHAKLEFDVKDAKIMAKVLNPDSLEWCKCFEKDNKFFIEIKTKKIGTILYTVDDYLMNIRVALEISSLVDKLVDTFIIE